MRLISLRKFILIFISLFLAISLFPSKNSTQNNLPQASKHSKTEPSLSQPKIFSSKSNQSYPQKKQILYKVKRVIDGDTIELENGERVRYIGIDTPELYEKNGPECYAVQAKLANEKLTLGKKVRLEKDVSERDKYGRLLPYVYVGDIFVNEYLVKEGYAFARTFPPDVKYQEVFQKAEKYARENKKGLWADNVCKPTPYIKTAADKKCQYPCNGSDRDCSDFKTQAEAQEFFECCGFNAYYDPMNLDSIRVGDGIPCESLP